MGSNASALAGTPTSFSLLQPWVAPIHPNVTGIFLGIDLRTGKSLFFDPWQLKVDRKIHSTSALLTGQKDAGKSALMKSLFMRLMAMQAGSDGHGRPQAMRGRVSDRKLIDGSGEYTLLTEHLYGDVVSLLGQGSINIFDPEMHMSELDMYEVALQACEMAANRTLRGIEPLVLQVGINRMVTYAIPTLTVLEGIVARVTAGDIRTYFESINTPLLADLEEVLQTDPSRLNWLKAAFKEPAHINEQEVHDAAARVATFIGLVLRGDFGTIFNGTRSLRSVLSGSMVNLDWNGLTDKAVALLEAMIYKWHTVALRNNDLAVIPHINGSDEEHGAIQNVVHSRFKVDYTKKSRSVPTFDMDATQFEQEDIENAGPEGSELRNLAANIQLGYGMRWIGSHPRNEDTMHGLSKLGLSDMDVEQIVSFLPERPGQFCLLIPNQPAVFYQHILTPTEMRLSVTNKASEDMVDGRIPTHYSPPPVMTDAEVRQYTEMHGAIQIGAEA